MPMKCCVPNCKIESDDPAYSGISFHKLPKDVNIQQKWLNSVNSTLNVQLEAKKVMYFCNQHFEPQAFYFGGECKYKRIKKECFPTIFFYDGDHENLQPPDSEPKSSFQSLLENLSHEGKEKNIITCDVQTQSKTVCRCKEQDDLVVTQRIVYDPCESVHGSSSSLLNENKSHHETCESSLESVHTEETRRKEISSLSNNVWKKSIANMDFNTFNLSDSTVVLKLLEKARLEIRELKKKNKNQGMKLARYGKRMKNARSLCKVMKDKKFITEKVSKRLEVSHNLIEDHDT